MQKKLQNNIKGTTAKQSDCAISSCLSQHFDEFDSSKIDYGAL